MRQFFSFAPHDAANPSEVGGLGTTTPTVVGAYVGWSAGSSGSSAAGHASYAATYGSATGFAGLGKFD